MEDANERPRISFSLSKAECAPQEINSREIRLHLPFSAIGINATVFEKREFILKVTFSLPLPSSMLKLPIPHGASPVKSKWQLKKNVSICMNEVLIRRN